MKTFYKNILVIVSALTLSLFISYGSAQAVPSGAPNNNIAQLIHVGGSQAKAGRLAVGSANTPFTFGSATADLDINSSTGILDTISLFVLSNANVAKTSATKLKILNSGALASGGSANIQVDGLIRSSDLTNTTNSRICADPQGKYILCNPTVPGLTCPPGSGQVVVNGACVCPQGQNLVSGVCTTPVTVIPGTASCGNENGVTVPGYVNTGSTLFIQGLCATGTPHNFSGNPYAPSYFTGANAQHLNWQCDGGQGSAPVQCSAPQQYLSDSCGTANGVSSSIKPASNLCKPQQCFGIYGCLTATLGLSGVTGVISGTIPEWKWTCDNYSISNTSYPNISNMGFNGCSAPKI